MPIRVALGFLVAALSLSPPAAVAQRPAELAFSDPQPHFVAAWAPKKPREVERSAALIQRVSLEIADVPLDLALKTLIQEAGLNITYSPAVLPAGKRVTIKAGDIAVVTALTEMLFRSGLDVVVDRDGTLALVVCRHPAPRAEIQDSGTIVGTVTDRATGAPIVGATVAVERTRQSATTVSDGSYRIDGVEPGTYTVRARYIGYAPLAVQVVVPEGGEVMADLGLLKSTQKLDELVTTGTVVPTEVKALPTPVSIIGADQILEQHPRTVGQLFRQAVPGGVAPDLGPFTQQTNTSVRGASSLVAGAGTMKVYLDGVEITNRTFAAVDPTSIERIEVIRGPQAATIYGSDGIGGVMQVFTKRGSGSRLLRLEAQAALGPVQSSYTGSGALRQEYAASARYGDESKSFNIGAGYIKSGDWVPEYSLSNPSAYGALHLSQGAVAVDLSGRYYQQVFDRPTNPLLVETRFPAFSQPNYEQNNAREQTYGARVSYAASSWWQHRITIGVDQLSLSAHNTRARRTSPGDTLLFVQAFDQQKTSLAYSTSLNVPLTEVASAVLTAGAEHYALSSANYFTFGALNTTGTLATDPAQPLVADLADTKNTGVFAQGMLDIASALYITAGVRGERNSNFGDDIGTPLSPRGGLAYVRQIGKVTLKVRASYGEAIQPPSPSQKIGATTPSNITIPNTMLGPTRQRGGDGGIDLAFGEFGSLSVTYYNQTARDLIQSVLLSQNSGIATSQYQNIGRITNTGIEIEGAAHFGIIRLAGQYAHTRSRIAELGPNYSGDLKVGDQSLGIPRQTAGASVTVVPLQGTTLSGGLTYVGPRTDLSYVALFSCFAGTGPCGTSGRAFWKSYPAFAKVNIAAGQDLHRMLSAFVSIDNLTNTGSDGLADFSPVPGRTTMLGLRIKL